jgi:hypothetical protein
LHGCVLKQKRSLNHNMVIICDNMFKNVCSFESPCCCLEPGIKMHQEPSLHK